MHFLEVKFICMLSHLASPTAQLIVEIMKEYGVPPPKSAISMSDSIVRGLTSECKFFLETENLTKTQLKTIKIHVLAMN